MILRLSGGGREHGSEEGIIQSEPSSGKDLPGIKTQTQPIFAEIGAMAAIRFPPQPNVDPPAGR
jgi:hypothetical protein